MFDSSKFNLILASTSPRRKQLMTDMGWTFSVIPSHAEENVLAQWSFTETVENLARQKAEAIDGHRITDNTIVIAADTIVCNSSGVLGKPADEVDAKRMLLSLSGESHQVITGVCLRSHNFYHVFSVSTEVTFDTLSEEEITYYINRFHPYDKAGSYGIQEWIGLIAVESINGSFYNVMGLPTHRLYVELNNFIKENF